MAPGTLEPNRPPAGPGALVLIGGHEDRTGEREILREVVRLAGERRVVVATVASSVAEELWDEYARVFREMGASEVAHLEIIGANGHGRVLGSGAVYVVDGREISHNGFYEREAEEAVSLFDIRLHVIAGGDQFSFSSRRPVARTDDGGSPPAADASPEQSCTPGSRRGTLRRWTAAPESRRHSWPRWAVR